MKEKKAKRKRISDKKYWNKNQTHGIYIYYSYNSRELWNIELIGFFMERFAVKDFSLGVIIPNIENEIYCSDYMCMVNLMTTSACCLLKRIAYSKRISKICGLIFCYKEMKKKKRNQWWYITWLLNFYFELLLHITETYLFRCYFLWAFLN